MTRLIWVLFLAGCGGGSVEMHAEAPRDESPADGLARRVAEAAGSARWSEVAELRFHFVVTADGARRADIAHRWDVRGRRDRVTWEEEGRRYDVVVSLDSREGTGTV